MTTPYGYQPINLDFLSQGTGGNTPSQFLNIGNTPMINDIVNNGGTQISPMTQSSAPLINPGQSDPNGLSFFGKDGWGGLALQGANTLLGGYMGFKQLGLMKDQLDFQKKAFNKNYESQKRLTNASLRDRQQRRYYENPDFYQSPDEYMKQNGVQ